MARRTQTFLKEFVVLFGFLNGLWLAIGVNPGEQLLEVLRGIVERLVSGELVAFLFTALPIAFLAAMLWIIHKRGGWTGFLAVGLGFLAGIQVLAQPAVSFALLVTAMLVGWIATRR